MKLPLLIIMIIIYLNLIVFMNNFNKLTFLLFTICNLDVFILVCHVTACLDKLFALF